MKVRTSGVLGRGYIRLFIRTSILAIVALTITATICVVVQIVRGPQVVKHASPLNAPYSLPAQATDIFYITRPPFWPNRACEFSISEEAFVVWATENGYELKEIDEPYRIYRYAFFIRNGNSEEREAIIADGLFSGKMSKPDAGMYIAYNRAQKRAYYWAHSR